MKKYAKILYLFLVEPMAPLSPLHGPATSCYILYYIYLLLELIKQRLKFEYTEDHSKLKS